MRFELAKGVKDFGPEEQIIKQELIHKLRSIFERYGYSPMETPVIERLDTLTAKSGAGETADVIKEIFRFSDQGKRELGLKFDQTVPLARYMALNPTTKLPFKRYIIDRSFRDGPIKLGRYREFYQCDVDIVGCSKMKAEIELIELTLDAFREIGFCAEKTDNNIDTRIEINNRVLLYEIFKECEIEESRYPEAAVIVDKVKKVTQEQIYKEFSEIGINQEIIDRLYVLLFPKGTNQEIIQFLTSIFNNRSEIAMNAIAELNEIIISLDEKDSQKIDINLALARGLNYYTGTIFEAYLCGSKMSSSVAGGGRYDKMIGEYAGRGNYPAIGISFGLAPILDAMKLNGYEIKKTTAEVMIIPINEYKKAKEVAKYLRSKQINVQTDLNDKGVSKNLDYAEKYSIPYVIFIGEEEARDNKVKLRDMRTGKEDLISVEDATQKLIIYRNKDELVD